MLSIKEYAEKHSITIQAVYQQINRKQNKEFLSQHTQKIKGVKYLDDEAVEFLESKRENSPSVIIQSDDKEHIEHLENENKKLLIKVAELQESIILKSDKIEQLQEANIRLLEEQKEEPIKKSKSFWKKFFKGGE